MIRHLRHNPSCRRAIVTMTVGQGFQERWNRLCLENWLHYCEAIDCDLLVLMEMPDSCDKARRRSPSWQKCLLPGMPELQRYEQVAWVDADIYFNPLRAESLFDAPTEAIGVVDSYSDPTVELNTRALQRVMDRLQGTPYASLVQRSARQAYSSYDPGMALDRMLNAGVICFSPRRHAELFRYVYDKYDEKGAPNFFENVPLSYEIVASGLAHWMDSKFNHLWTWDKELYYPFLLHLHLHKSGIPLLKSLLRGYAFPFQRKIAAACISSSLHNCQVLHFAGCANEMEFVDAKALLSDRLKL